MNVPSLALALVPPALVGLAPEHVAHHKGRSFVRWWAFGTLAWIVAYPAALLAPPARGLPRASRAEETLTSPVRPD